MQFFPRKPFVGQSKLANGLLDLIHIDVCGPLNTQARGGFSYFITFTYDHSRYGYVYLMRYKSEVFVRFKEFRLEVENQTGCKIKTLRSDRGGEYLSGEFIDYLKENGYPKENAGYYYYDPSEQKVFVSRNAVFLERGFPMDTRRDEMLLKESSKAPQSNVGTSSAPTVSDNVSILRRSARVPQPPSHEIRNGLHELEPSLDVSGPTLRALSVVVKPKSIQIMLAIAAWYDYEIWQMNVKMAFLNGFVEEEIYMDQPEGITVVGEEQKVCHLQDPSVA
ncbi:UNVERIFIED_CONTAM: hypothetical protein Scaly_2241700 [Sesamum calycinum]|uniref:Integrase catalytic domain-containing protein n=1 Tax=Sesamum calycinum TaxID=2727403 RepID=A0AAW2MD77_9LAMI